MEALINWDIYEKAIKARGWKESWNIAVIDDDPDFRNLIEAATSPTIARITTYSALAAMPSVKQLRNFDAVLVDYYLENINGIQLSQYIDTFFPNVPVILISGGAVNLDTELWPESIKAFIPKWVGPHAIIHETLGILKGVKV